MSRFRSVLGAVFGFTVLSASLAGCTGTVPLEPAKDANNPGCAEIIVRLPDNVADLSKRETDAQATGAWGDPTGVILRCGLAEPGPTTMACISVNGIDWIQDDSAAPEHYRFITFGRSPATEVIVDHSAASNSTVLADLTSAISSLPPVGHCTSVQDTYDPNAESLTPTPSPETSETPAVG